MQTRRDFLTRVANTSVISLGLPLPHLWHRVAAAAEPRPDSPILVVIELTGGNDGLNTVIPYADDAYHQNRPILRLEKDKVLRLDDHVGLHSSMKGLHKLWEKGQVRIVQNVCYPNPNRSHFRSMEIWHTGVLGPAPPTGWLGAAADLHGSLQLCHVGEGVVPHAVLRRKGTTSSIRNLTDFQLNPGALLATPSPLPLSPGGRGRGEGAGVADNSLLQEIGKRTESTQELVKSLEMVSAQASTAAGSLEERLGTIRALIEAGTSFRLYYTALAGFDTHVSQRFIHQELLSTVSSALNIFLDGLRKSKLDERLVVLLFSEFGRRVRENGQGGTDHGTAAPVFLVGKSVKGGLLGPAPDLKKLDLGDLRFTIDFRDVYATLLRNWLKIDPKAVLGSRDETLELLV
jgi:uncharacterized protein (DUF1501 family)